MYNYIDGIEHYITYAENIPKFKKTVVTIIRKDLKLYVYYDKRLIAPAITSGDLANQNISGLMNIGQMSSESSQLISDVRILQKYADTNSIDMLEENVDYDAYNTYSHKFNNAVDEHGITWNVVNGTFTEKDGRPCVHLVNGYMQTPPINDFFNFGLDDFTIEFEYYLNEAVSSMFAFSNYLSSGFIFRLNPDDATIGTGFETMITGGANIYHKIYDNVPIGKWLNIKITRASATLRIQVNGELVYTNIDKSNIQPTNKSIVIGGYFDDDTKLVRNFITDGYVSKYRFIKGYSEFKE